MEKELGLSGVDTRKTGMHRLDPPGCYRPFLPILRLLG